MATRKIEGDSAPPPPSARGSSLRLIADNTAPISRRGGGAGASTVPTYPNAFVGRAAEIAALDRIVHSERARLVTIHGPGGMGKTRLVTAWAARQGSADVAYVALASITNGDHVPNAIAGALGLTVDPKSDPFVDILRALKNRETILVVDNLEHLISDSRVTGWLENILSSCPGVRIVCTSRERLGMTAEHLLELRGLSNPDDTAQSDASELFSRRAKQLLTTFDEKANADSVIAICRLLEGVPLGIELAATWVRVLRCDEILVEIKKTLDFLTADPRSGRDPRQSSMRAVFSQSWTLLREDEQRVLARLSIFRGGFDRAAAEKIAGASLGLLAGLLDRSLVRTRSLSASTTSTPRYDMHELLRQFAAEKLTEEERRKIALAHAEYFVEWTQAIHPQLRGEGQVNALTELSLDLENIRTAIEFTLEHERYDLAARIGWALWPFWWIRNMQREGRLFMEALLPHADRLDLFWRTQATIALGAMVYAQGDVEACVRYSHELERLAGLQNNAPRPLAFAYGGFGLGATAKGDFKTATLHLSKARQLFVEAGDPGIAAQAAAWMGTVYLLMGNLDLARSSAAAGLAEAIASGDRLANTSSRYCLARIALVSGRLDEAVDHLLSSIPASIAIEDRGSLSFIFELLAVVAVKAGAFESAAVLFGASDAVLEAIGHRGHTYYLPDTKGIAQARALAVEKLPSEYQGAYEDGKRASIEALVEHVKEGFAPLIEAPPSAPTPTSTPGSTPTSAPSPSSDATYQVRYFEEDDSIFINQDYLIKGISGRILWRLLQIHKEEGRTEFTNRELRLDPTLKLPGYKDNLESRLLLLMKRLEEKKTWLRVERSGRGRLRIILDATPSLTVVPPRSDNETKNKN